MAAPPILAALVGGEPTWVLIVKMLGAGFGVAVINGIVRLVIGRWQNRHLVRVDVRDDTASDTELRLAEWERLFTEARGLIAELKATNKELADDRDLIRAALDNCTGARWKLRAQVMLLGGTLDDT